jgi:glycosyltransferase involved in cell wall biosynthesis
MIKGLLSITIPSRNEQFLVKTVDDLLSKAEGLIEIIVVCDGVWADVSKLTDKRIRIIHHGTIRESKGMRASINAGMAIVQGEYVMKIDGHCMMSQGYDKELIKTITDAKEDATHWVVIPRRHRLDPDKWEIANGGKPPIDYMMIDYPQRKFNGRGIGLHGHIWNERYFERKNIMIDETMDGQGSFYFMTRKHWDDFFGKLDDDKYGPFAQEAEEVCLKTWFSGGKVVVNKNVWYAHLHKGKRGKNYGFSNEQYRQFTASIEKGRLYCNDYWINTKDYKYDFEWLIERFMPIPGWEKNWKERFKKEGLIK